MEPVNPVAIISPALDCESFEVGGLVYTRTDTLALGRARLLQRFQTELQFDMSIPNVQRGIMEAIADFNGLKLVDGCQKLGKLRDGLDLLGNNRFRQAEIVGLFYNAPGEDPTSYDYETVIKPKMAAWRAVDMDFFIRQAYALLLRTSTRYPPLQSLPPDPEPTSDPSQPA